ncbi:MAG TPA: EAL domain-containing protein [Sphingomicrobium sp.]|jgi:diguanylate cyclase (GGDEF)-like protein/PAS domain S-box-containing protein
MAFLSHGVVELTGYSPKHFESCPWADLIVPEDRKHLEADVEKAVAERRIFCLEYRIVTRAGQTVWVRDRGKAMYSETGDPLFLEGIITDISLEHSLKAETAAANEAESSLRARLSAVLESTSDCVITFDEAWRFTYLNSRASSELGPADELLGRHVLEVFPSVVETPFWATYQQVMADRKPRRVEGFVAGIDSWYEAYAAPSEGGISVFFSNIDNRKATDQALKDNHQRLQKTLDHIPQMVWSTRPDGHHDYFSGLWYEFTGVDAGATDGDAWNTVFHPDDRERAWDAWKHSLATGEPYEIEYRLRHVSGQYRWVLGRAWAERDEHGRIVRWYGTCTDVDDRVVAEQALQESEARTDRILNSVPQVTWAAGPDGKLNFVSQQWSVLYGGEPASLAGEGWLRIVHPDDVAEVATAWSAAMGRCEPYQNEFRVVLPDGSHRWVSVSALPDLKDGQLLGWYGTCADVHDRVVAQQALRDSEQLHRSILEASADCIKVIDLDGRIELMNPPGQKAIGIEVMDDWLGRRWPELWPGESREVVEAALDAARLGNVVRFSGYCPILCGEGKWWDVVVSPISNDCGVVQRILAISRDITREREAAEQLKWASEHDALTSLPNRRAFQSRLQAATIRSMEAGTSVGLLLIDLDHFKYVNDSLGHAAGDKLLEAFGARLKESIRSTDFVARLGGDEFAVILEGQITEHTLLETGESVLQRVKQPMTFNGRMMSVGASIGGAIFPDDAQNANELFNNADTALYALKERGRGGTKMFHQHLREEAQKVATQLTQARIAVSENSVEPYYQQKVHLGTGEVRGFEALLRWHHPTRGMQMPETVAEAFKDYELATKIGDLMHRRVLADMRAWLRQGLQFGVVAVNAAPAEFLRDDFAERLLFKVQEYGVPPDLLELEVTEHVFYDRTSNHVSRALATLNRAGVRVALDDFGTGYSSLSHLRDFPVDVLKIDQSFVARLEDDPEIAAIVAAVIDLGARLKIEVVAEGVESARQRQLLREQGCVLGQGHLFGRAIRPDEVPPVLTKARLIAA